MRAQDGSVSPGPADGRTGGDPDPGHGRGRDAGGGGDDDDDDGGGGGGGGGGGYGGGSECSDGTDLHAISRMDSDCDGSM